MPGQNVDSLIFDVENILKECNDLGDNPPAEKTKKIDDSLSKLPAMIQNELDALSIEKERVKFVGDAKEQSFQDEIIALENDIAKLKNEKQINDLKLKQLQNKIEEIRAS